MPAAAAAAQDAPPTRPQPTAPAEPLATAPTAARAPPGRRAGLKLLTARTPTNHNMLLFRTLNREMGRPNANSDGLAPLLRDRLMPLRMRLLKLPGARAVLRRGLEHPRLGCPGVVNFVDARTSWFDAVVEDALARGGIKQVVVVAAGFDTRAYRLGAKYPDVSFWEVDLPAASEAKQRLVADVLPHQPHPRPTYLSADLSSTALDVLLLSAAPPGAPPGAAAAFDPALPTLFTAEGLIYYLPHQAVHGLFAAMLRVAAPGSRLAFDFLHQQVLDGSAPPPPAYRVTAASVANKGEPFLSGIPDSEAAVQAFLDSVPSPGRRGGGGGAGDDAVAAAAALLVAPGPAAPAAPHASAQELPAREAGAAGAAGAGPGGASLVDEEEPAPAPEPAAEAAEAADAGGGGGAAVATWRVTDYMGPRDMVARQLPHLAWGHPPPILDFYSFAAASL